MKRNSLGWWLAASNVAIVLLVAAGISYFAIDMLRDLADGQQKIRVQLAGANSRAEITRLSEDTLTYARVLAERPPLRRLVTGSGREDLPQFLRRFCETSELDACAVFDGAQLVAASGPDLPWEQLYTVAMEQGERFMAVPTGTQFSVVGATAKLPAQFASFTVLVVFRVLGRNYDAAVIAAGFIGFGLGATPTAMANMTAVTQRHGASHVAFLVVPLVGAFFLDLLNTVAIRFFLTLN